MKRRTHADRILLYLYSEWRTDHEKRVSYILLYERFFKNHSGITETEFRRRLSILEQQKFIEGEAGSCRITLKGIGRVKAMLNQRSQKAPPVRIQVPSHEKILKNVHQLLGILVAIIVILGFFGYKSSCSSDFKNDLVTRDMEKRKDKIVTRFKEQEQLEVIAPSSLSLYTNPEKIGPVYEVVCKVYPGDLLVVVGEPAFVEGKAWYLVIHKNGQGWICEYSPKGIRQIASRSQKIL